MSHAPSQCLWGRSSWTLQKVTLRPCAATEQRQQQVRNRVMLLHPVIRGLFPKPGLHTHWGSSAAPVRMPLRYSLWTVKRGLWIVIFEGSPDDQARLRPVHPSPDTARARTRVPRRGNCGMNRHFFLSFRWHLTHCHLPVHRCSHVYCFWYLLNHPRQPSSHQAACILQPPRNQHFTKSPSPTS